MNPEPVDDLTSFHVRHAADGRPESVDWVVSHFDPLVEALVRFRIGQTVSSDEARDITNEVWLTVLDRFGDLRPRDGRYAPVLAKFLSTTALNKCNNHLARRIRRQRFMEEHDSSGGGDRLGQLPQDTLGVVTRAANGELRNIVAECLERLEKTKREVLVLRLLEQRTNLEIARLLKLESNTVAVRYRRALEVLKRELPAAAFEGLQSLQA